MRERRAPTWCCREIDPVRAVIDLDQHRERMGVARSRRIDLQTMRGAGVSFLPGRVSICKRGTDRGRRGTAKDLIIERSRPISSPATRRGRRPKRWPHSIHSIAPNTWSGRQRTQSSAAKGAQARSGRTALHNASICVANRSERSTLNVKNKVRSGTRTRQLAGVRENGQKKAGTRCAFPPPTTLRSLRDSTQPLLRERE